MKVNTILIVLVAILYAACNHNHDAEIHNHEDEGQHNHENVKIQIATYSSDYELFAEADPFIVGETSHILAHFSKLPGFTALEKGSVTLHLTVNGKEISKTLDKPTRKGIYSFKVKPIAEGKGTLIFEIKAADGDPKTIISEITVFDDKHDAIHAAEDNEVLSGNGIAFTKEQSWKIDFATELAKTEPFGQVIKTTAHIQPAQGDEILVSAKTNGILLLSSNKILEGKSVLNGQVLFTISGSGLANNNSAVRFVEAKNNFEKARSDYERSKELAKDKIVSEKDLLIAKHQYDNAKVVYDNLNKNFSSSGENVSSPMNGFIKQLFVQNGQYVEAGQPIVSISQNETLVLKAEVQQKYISVLGLVNDANIRTLHDNITYTLEQLNGELLSYGRTTNDDNYLIPISLQIDNKGSFVPGSFVEVYLKTLTNSQALTIPNSSLLEEQGNFSVFVQITPEQFEKREIKLGATDGLRTEILKGINHGERVISKGAIFIKLAQATGSLDAHSGHVH